MKKILIGAGVVVIVVVAALLLLVGNLGDLIKKGVETAGPKILQADVKLAKADISVTSGSGELIGLTVGNPQGFSTDYAFDMDTVKIELDPKSITSDTIHIKRIIISGPKIIYEGAIGNSNINQLIENAQSFAGKGKSPSESDKTSSAPEKEGKKVIIDSLEIEGGEASLSMNLLQGKKVSVPLPEIQMQDIGKNKNLNIAGTLKLILAEINKKLVPAIQEKITGLGLSAGEIQSQVKDRVQQETQKGMDKLKGMFNR